MNDKRLCTTVLFSINYNCHVFLQISTQLSSSNFVEAIFQILSIHQSINQPTLSRLCLASIGLEPAFDFTAGVPSIREIHSDPRSTLKHLPLNTIHLQNTASFRHSVRTSVRSCKHPTVAIYPYRSTQFRTVFPSLRLLSD